VGLDVDKMKEEQVFDETEPSSATLKKSLLFVERKSFPMPKHWTPGELDQLEFPNDLTMLSSTELGNQMGIWTSVIAYTQFQVAMADVENTAKYNKLEYERRKLYLSLVDLKRGTEEQRKSILKTDGSIVKLQADSEVARAKYVLLKALLDSYSKYFNAFSRELSRRGVVGGERPPRADFDDEPNMDLSEGRERSKSLFHTVSTEGGFDKVGSET
jgi:hypothetical protein